MYGTVGSYWWTCTPRVPLRMAEFYLLSSKLSYALLAFLDLEGLLRSTGSDPDPNPPNQKSSSSKVKQDPQHSVHAVFRVRIHRIHVFFGLPDSDPLVRGRVSDPHWFNADPDTDPDPAFFLIADPDPASGSKVWWSKIEKNLQLEI